MNNRLILKTVGKSYQEWSSEWHRIASWFINSIKPKTQHWVLRDINLEAKAGEAVAIIGQNGAGKSTLLKLITGTIVPTQGSIKTNGKIAAILELGMGFNLEMTGRQNAYHAASLMGHSMKNIEQVMPEIETFAEIGEYFDQPMRTYSTGMQMRVAFSVATAFKPDLLIIDEVLAVGDSYFQHKSFDKIRQFKEQGVTILLVTHSMTDVRTLCDRVVLLDKGQMLKEGLPDEVVDYYNALTAEKENAKLTVEQRRLKDGWLVTKSGTEQAKVKSLRLLDSVSGEEISAIKVGQTVELVLEAIAMENLPKLVLGFKLRDKQGHIIWGSNTWYTEQIEEELQVGEVVTFRLRFTCTLGPGSYSVSPALVDSHTHLTKNYQWIDNLLVFEVINTEKYFFIGCNYLDAQFSVERQDKENEL